MKRSFLILTVLLTLILLGCGQGQIAADGEDASYYSDISKEDCYLCGGGIEDAVPFVWGQDNIALLSLNTFEVIPLEINRYDRSSRQLIEEYAGVISLAGGKSQSGGFSANMMLDYDRGYADGTVDLNNDKVLDPDKAAGFLCEVCLNKILPAQADRCFGIGAVNLATKQIRVFEGQLGGFTLGDFHIDYHLRDAGSEQQMDILVFYCPVRYQNITSELKVRK